MIQTVYNLHSKAPDQEIQPETMLLLCLGGFQKLNKETVSQKKRL